MLHFNSLGRCFFFVESNILNKFFVNNYVFMKNHLIRVFTCVILSWSINMVYDHVAMEKGVIKQYEYVRHNIIKWNFQIKIVLQYDIH